MTTHYTAHEIKHYLPANFRPSADPGRIGRFLTAPLRRLGAWLNDE